MFYGSGGGGGVFGISESDDESDPDPDIEAGGGEDGSESESEESIESEESEEDESVGVGVGTDDESCPVDFRWYREDEVGNAGISGSACGLAGKESVILRLAPAEFRGAEGAAAADIVADADAAVDVAGAAAAAASGNEDSACMPDTFAGRVDKSNRRVR